MLKFLLLASAAVFANDKSICGQEDNRSPSRLERVGRMVESLTSYSPCTATLIGKNCLVSAGHCKMTDNWLTEFNTPESHPETGRLIHSKKEDIYELDKIYGHTDMGPGNDWLVYSVKNNKLTMKAPGELYGFYKIAKRAPKAGDQIQIAGYGRDYDEKEKERNFAQQISFGPILNFISNQTKIIHRADTLGGNSGSSIVDVNSQKIIGIHTHGGCWGDLNGNKATSIFGNVLFQNAIKACLDANKKGE